MNDAYPIQLHIIESDMHDVASDDALPKRPANHPPVPGQAGPGEFIMIESPMLNIPSAAEGLVHLTELVGLTRFKISTLSPSELDSFRSIALPQLQELQRILNSA